MSTIKRLELVWNQLAEKQVLRGSTIWYGLSRKINDLARFRQAQRVFVVRLSPPQAGE